MNTIDQRRDINRSTENHNEQGTALTVILVVLASVVTLSFGTLFLTQII